MMIEMGLTVDVSLLRIVGLRGFVLAWLASAFSILLGMILALVIQGMNHDTSLISLFAAGAVFGPSSMGLVLWTLRGTQTANGRRAEDYDYFNTPTGQLIVAATLFDNVLALIVLSQLQSLGDLFVHTHPYHRDRDDIWNLILAMISSRIYIWFGSALAVWYVPRVLHTLLYRLPPALAGEGLGVSPDNVLLKPQSIGKVGLILLFAMMFFLMGFMEYTRTSYLMGCFLAGLSFCGGLGWSNTTTTFSQHHHHLNSHYQHVHHNNNQDDHHYEVHTEFLKQFKRILRWLMRLFFAASVGFHYVSFDQFWSFQVLFQALIFCFAWAGKLLAGFLLVPHYFYIPDRDPYQLPSQDHNNNNYQHLHRAGVSHAPTSPLSTAANAAPFSTTTTILPPPYTGAHLRDCVLTGLSMATQGEMAMVVALTSLRHGLISQEIYSSLVLSVILSAIVPPYLARWVMRQAHSLANRELKALARAELERKHDLDRPHAPSATTTSSSTTTPQTAPDNFNIASGVHGDGGESVLDLLSLSFRGDNELLLSAARAATATGGMSSSSRGTAIRNQHSVFFLCIQTYSEAYWGFLQSQSMSLARLGLEVMDYRIWHPTPRMGGVTFPPFGGGNIQEEDSFTSTTPTLNTALVVSEVFVRGILSRSPNDGFTTMEALEHKIQEVKETLETAMDQPKEVGRVHVQRWYPGVVVEETVESHPQNDAQHQQARQHRWHLALEDSVHEEASSHLSERQIQEILEGLPELHPYPVQSRQSSSDQSTAPSSNGQDQPSIASGGSSVSESRQPDRRSRRTVRLSPVIGGGLFHETGVNNNNSSSNAVSSSSSSPSLTGDDLHSRRHRPLPMPPPHIHGKRVEILVEDVDEPYTARMGAADLRRLRKAYNTTKPSMASIATAAGRRDCGNDSDSECGYDDDYDDHDNPPVGGGLNQEIMDLHIQPIMHDVTYMLRGLVRHAVPPPIPRPRQNRVRLEPQDTSSLSTSELFVPSSSSPTSLHPPFVATTGRNPTQTAHWGGRGRKTLRNRSSSPPPQFFGRGRNRRSGYEPVQQPQPSQAAAPPPAGTNDVVGQALDLLHTAPRNDGVATTPATTSNIPQFGAAAGNQFQSSTGSVGGIELPQTHKRQRRFGMPQEKEEETILFYESGSNRRATSIKSKRGKGRGNRGEMAPLV